MSTKEFEIEHPKSILHNLPLAALRSDIVLDWSSNLALVEEGSVYVLV